jgi:hypothetical protein
LKQQLLLHFQKLVQASMRLWLNKRKTWEKLPLSESGFDQKRSAWLPIPNYRWKYCWSTVAVNNHSSFNDFMIRYKQRSAVSTSEQHWRTVTHSPGTLPNFVFCESSNDSAARHTSTCFDCCKLASACSDIWSWNGEVIIAMHFSTQVWSC